MILTAKVVNRIKDLADSMGPSLHNPPYYTIRLEEFDYELSKIIYKLFSKNDKKIILTAPNEEKIKMDAEPYQDILRMMSQQDSSASGYEMDMHEKRVHGKKKRFNGLLRETLHSLEQIVHQNSFVDKHMPKTKDGKMNHFYRAFMRSIIANKERNLELIGNTNKESIGNALFVDLEKIKNEYKQESKKHLSSEELAKIEEKLKKFDKISEDLKKDSRWVILTTNKPSGIK